LTATTKEFVKTKDKARFSYRLRIDDGTRDGPMIEVSKPIGEGEFQSPEHIREYLIRKVNLIVDDFKEMHNPE